MKNYRKLYTSVHGKIEKGWDVHHIDWDGTNNEISNLIAIPKKIHQLVHKHFGYVDRTELEVLLVEYQKMNNSKFFKGKKISDKFLIHKFEKFVNMKKGTDLAYLCKGKMDYLALEYYDNFKPFK